MKTYRLSPARRMGNFFMSALVRLGVGPRSNYLLTVTGRKTGQPRTTPVTPVENDGGRWLVAPYGPVGWVHNVRAAGTASLRRGSQVENVLVAEVSAAAAAPILKEYVTNVSLVRSYFDAAPDAAISAFEAEAERHPVFRIEPIRRLAS